MLKLATLMTSVLLSSPLAWAVCEDNNCNATILHAWKLNGKLIVEFARDSKSDEYLGNNRTYYGTKESLTQLEMAVSNDYLNNTPITRSFNPRWKEEAQPAVMTAVISAKPVAHPAIEVDCNTGQKIKYEPLSPSDVAQLQKLISKNPAKILNTDRPSPGAIAHSPCDPLFYPSKGGGKPHSSVAPKAAR